jgi:hypothetical protein
MFNLEHFMTLGSQFTFHLRALGNFGGGGEPQAFDQGPNPPCLNLFLMRGVRILGVGVRGPHSQHIHFILEDASRDSQQGSRMGLYKS